jgi:Ca2+-binding RTX toxin-like protein
VLTGGEEDDQLDGGDGNDELWADGGRGRSHAGEGNDKLAGGAGNDELHGQFGDDTLDDGAGNDRLTGDDGNDILFSDPLGADEIDGDAGTDTLDDSARTADLLFTMGIISDDDGQAGEHDTIGSEVEGVIGGSGNDVFEDEWDVPNRFEGRAGADTFYVHRATDTMLGGEGTDTLSFGPYDGRDRIYFRVAIDAFTGKAVSAEPAFAALDLTFGEMERFIGSNQSDSFQGTLGGDYFDGLPGDDAIHGGFGADTIYAGDGDDTIDGDDGDDHLYGGAGADTLRGGNGEDVLTGDAGHDSFDGGEPSGGGEKDVAVDWADEPVDGSCVSTLQCP